MKIAHIVGTRPNLVKLDAVYPKVGGTVYHTGQHWGEMSDPFVREYNLPNPLPLGTLHGDLAIVYGDCNATLDGAVMAKTRRMKLAHVEAGLRSGDMSMPEEHNRIAVDHMSDYLFATCQDGVDNLTKEGVRGEIHLVGNVVMDTLKRYGVLTLHRPFNVDDRGELVSILKAASAAGLLFMWPCHPRYKSETGWAFMFPRLKMLPPMPRGEFIDLLRGACVVVTDSGGVQEEAAWLGRKCITVRPSTERPITLSYGNELVEVEALTQAIRTATEIPLWDGRAAERIAEVLHGC